MKRKLLTFLLVCLMLASVGCGSAPVAAAPSDTPSPTDTPAPTDTPLPTATLTPTATPTETPNATATAEMIAGITATAKFEANQTKTAVAAQTQQARRTASAEATQAAQQLEDDLFAKLAADGALTLGHGPARDVFDFDESWAQRGWYQWWQLDVNLSDFVISTHIEWKAAQEPRLGSGGCGFVFRIQENDDHMMVYYDLQNSPRMAMVSRGNFSWSSTLWKDADLTENASETSGSVDMLVVVEKDIVTVYLNGNKAGKFYANAAWTGDMGYTIISGTNKDFGTTCKMTDTRYWVLK